MAKDKDEREDEDLEEDRDEDDEGSDNDKDEKDESIDVGDSKAKGKETDDVEIIEDERIVTSPGAKDAAGETQEEKRERRRREKQQKREKRLSAERRDKAMIAQLVRENEQTKRALEELKNKVPQFEQRMASQDELQIDNAMQQQSGLYHQALAHLNKAITEGNGDAAAQAQKHIDDARGKYEKLANLKQGISQSFKEKAEEKPVVQSKIQEGDMLKIYRKRWVTDNEWYDPNGTDDESETARAIDKALVKEGLDPNRREFWDEFKTRLREEMPHVFEEKAKTKTNPRPRQTNGSVAHDSQSGEPGKVRIPQRVVQMAKDAGLWDDEKKRKMFIANWKQQNGVAV